MNLEILLRLIKHFLFLLFLAALFLLKSQGAYGHDNVRGTCTPHIPNQWNSCGGPNRCVGPDVVNDWEVCFIEADGVTHTGCYTIADDLHQANAPQCVPNCDENSVCTGDCEAPPNTCGTNNGSKGGCEYTTHNGSSNCNRVGAPDEPCGKNNCETGRTTCQGNQCVAIPTSTPTLPPPSGNPCESNCGPFQNCYDGSTKICHYSSGSNCLQCNAPDSANCTPSGCKFTPTATPTVTPKPTPTPTPRATSTTPISRATPVPTASPRVTSTPMPRATPVPTVPPRTTLTPRPTSSPVPTATPIPTASPTPAFNPAACKCDGIVYTNLFSGQPTTITSFGKVEGADTSKARIVDQKFFLAEGAETAAKIIARSGSIPATVVSQTPTLVRYKSDWNLTLPQLKIGATYRIWSQINCQPKLQALNYTPAGKVVLATSASTQPKSFIERVIEFLNNLFGGGRPSVTTSTPSPTPEPGVGTGTILEELTPTGKKSLQLETIYPVEVYQKTCSFIKFRSDQGTQ